MNTEFNRLVIAAYRLPFKLMKTKNEFRAVQNSGGLVSAILALSEKLKKNTYIRSEEKIIWAGTDVNMPKKATPGNFQNEHFNILPIHIPVALDNLYYGGFCNDLIWPLFHYFPSYSVYNNEYFRAYKEANQIFCDEIVKIIKPGDFIWIHDYQLLLLPEMIKKKIHNATIGFFLHIPFPSYEIFRLMPRQWRHEILNGMLGADLVGFHTNDYTQHFIKCVKRTTGLECRQNTIYSQDNIIKADAFPIGINYDKFHSACYSKAVMREKFKISEQLNKQKLVFSVDRLDYSKGLLNRLKGFETFLEMYPKWHKKVVFNMVVVPSRDNIEKYKEMKKEIEYTIGNINGKYSSLSWRPIIYQYKSLSFNELVALYDKSDVGLITPLRDGMNLVAKEYVACQAENRGVLILSEMAGAAAELSEALIVNPADNFEMAENINTALGMKKPDKLARLKLMQKRISTYNVFTWANDFFNQTYEIKEQQRVMNVKFINKTISNEIESDYKKATKRIFFLDYDGTLVSFAKYPELAVIDKNTLNIVNKLCEDEKNHIVIISGRDRNFLEKQFEGTKVTMIAEHGYFIKKNNSKWEATINSHSQWKDTVMPLLLEYVSRCNGTFIEEKTGSIAWHYRNAESDFAQLRLNELRDDLAELIRHKTDFEIIEGHKVLEIKSGKYDKGLAAMTVLKENHFDFILAAGDDKTDEDLFKVLSKNAYTIRVGSSPSIAKYNVTDFSLLLRLLKRLAE